MYSMLALCTEGEAGAVVRGVTSMDGILAYGLLHERYNRRTLGRMFRLRRSACTHVPRRTWGRLGV